MQCFPGCSLTSKMQQTSWKKQAASFGICSKKISTEYWAVFKKTKKTSEKRRSVLVFYFIVCDLAFWECRWEYRNVAYFFQSHERSQLFSGCLELGIVAEPQCSKYNSTGILFTCFKVITGEAFSLLMTKLLWLWDFLKLKFIQWQKQFNNKLCWWKQTFAMVMVA